MTDFCGAYGWVKTRKEHKCSLCRKTFAPKTVMIRFSGKNEGDFYFGYQCFGCTAFANFLTYGADNSGGKIPRISDSEILEYLYDRNWDRKDWELYHRDFENITIEEALTYNCKAVRFEAREALKKR